jgi:hypothetical protein
VSTQYVTNPLIVLRSRLDVEHASFDASAEVRAALTSIKPYIEMWVLPVINVAEGRNIEMRERIIRDALQIRKELRDKLFPEPER